MAIYGWENIEEAERYTRKADRKRLSGESMHLISVPPKPKVWEVQWVNKGGGDPNGNRTRVSTLKGLCPNR